MDDVMRTHEVKQRKTMRFDQTQLDLQGPHKLRDEELCKYSQNGLDEQRIKRLLTHGHVNRVFISI